MSLNPQVAGQVRALPERPGIYIFRDAGGQAVYVGKAKSLRKRGLSYLRREGDERTASMLSEADSVEFVVTDSEADALLLENNWIKRLKPRHNVLLKDDKTYPYVKLTLGDEYPRIGFTRRIRADQSEYFGPYLPAGLARKAIKLVQKLFQLRVCRIHIDGSLPRPCLYFDMRRCLGPCVDGLTSLEQYQKAVEDARLFLSGRDDILLRRLREKMSMASKSQEFERAAEVRDVIAEVEAVTQKRRLSSVHGEDVDVFGIHLVKNQAAVAVLIMRGGQILDRRELFWERATPDVPLDAERLLSQVLPQFYDRTTFVPQEIHLPVPIEGEEALCTWLSKKKGRRVYVRVPSRGAKAHRVSVANRNAELSHRRRFRTPSAQARGAEVLAEHLHLEGPPQRIEGFDVSTLAGQETVASLVVWEGGAMQRREYRSFNIRTVSGLDDYAALEEAVGRRYRRRLKEFGGMPDLILVDGGRGQLNAAIQALAQLGVEETAIVGLAKREEAIYLPETPEALILGRTDPGLKILQHIRDEAHRFAISKHRKRRSRRMLRSRLDGIRGIGPRRRRHLLAKFGSYAGVETAGSEELEAALGRKVGQSVFQQIHTDKVESEA